MTPQLRHDTMTLYGTDCTIQFDWGRPLRQNEIFSWPIMLAILEGIRQYDAVQI